MLAACTWKHGKAWVYSITYDEALADLHRFAIPHHEALALPGHVEAVVGQLGQVRAIGASSYNGMRHMDGAALRDLLDRGWGVGNHSWSHEIIAADGVDRELRQAREVLEEAIGAPVDLYCSPGNNANMSQVVLAACRRLGYLGAMSITDGVNRPGDELFWLDRTPLHEQYYEPFFSRYDPYRNLRLAAAEGGWVIDYCHCPLEQAVHPNKDCTQAQLRRRLETVRDEGGDAVWCAVPEEVVCYHLCRRHLRVEALAPSAGWQRRYRLAFEGLPARVRWRQLTLEADVPAPWCRAPVVSVDGAPRPAQVVRPGRLRFSVDVGDGIEVALGAPEASRG